MKFFEKIYKNYICVNPDDYGLGINVEINKVLFFIMLGLCAACIITNYYNSYMRLILKKLFRSEAFGEDNSKSLAFLGLSDNKRILKFLAREGGALKRVVFTAGEKKLTYEEYIAVEKQKKAKKKNKKKEEKTKDIKENKLSDISSKSFYIPEDMKDYAEKWLSKNDASLLKTILSCSLIFAFYIAILFIMPSLLSLISSII